MEMEHDSSQDMKNNTVTITSAQANDNLYKILIDYNLTIIQSSSQS